MGRFLGMTLIDCLPVCLSDVISFMYNVRIISACIDIASGYRRAPVNLI